MNDTSSAAAQAVAPLASLFFEILAQEETPDFESFEDSAIRAGHEIMAHALGLALSRYDRVLCSCMQQGLRVHDVRSRTLATEVGDVGFECRRVRDRHGASFSPLSEALDIPWGCRVSPGATAFLVEAAAEVSYASAARLLCRKGGSRVSATSVMRAMRSAGERCAEGDERAVSDLFGSGVVPDADTAEAEICLEADGTWVRLQGISDGAPKKVEVKAMAAYSGKVRKGRKVERAHVVRHGCVASPQRFWPEGVAVMGSRFDLSKVERVHLGTDGEGWCKSAGSYLPMRMEVTGHLDPFHVYRAVLSCFGKDDRNMGWQVLDVLRDGGKNEAACLLEACRGMGLAREKQAENVIGYLRNNMELIEVDGPSLGTMESENQHLYKSRMASVPCAWSRRGASDMARIRSRVHSRRAIPRQTRDGSVTPCRRKRTEARTLKGLPKGLPASAVVQSEGRGYLPPQASLSCVSAEVRYSAGLDSAMIGLPW